MYYIGREPEDVKPKPFIIICNNCKSHNVSVTAYEFRDLRLRIAEIAENLVAEL